MALLRCTEIVRKSACGLDPSYLSLGVLPGLLRWQARRCSVWLGSAPPLYRPEFRSAGARLLLHVACGVADGGGSSRRGWDRQRCLVVAPRGAYPAPKHAGAHVFTLRGFAGGTLAPSGGVDHFKIFLARVVWDSRLFSESESEVPPAFSMHGGG